ncbi:hypothetical protein [Cytobacillus sp. IB215665]|uniref:hypothetical protein n=1 Tax=Cytobacillus sp. IB215665 TaxID=3097357 RepID=UPI002A0ED47D|nr:hypothetical protein [Cytobacillus sp. IB215665]MDX8365503.1 hypothetical protein [Cytobacillus sp. IB215665]
MTNCKCKGKDNEIFCNCQFGTVTLSDGNTATPFVPLILTTDKINVTEKDWVAKVDTMADLQKTSGSSLINVNYVVERITGGTTTTLCSYNLVDARTSNFTLTPNNTVCDYPPLGCHMYRLSILDNGTNPSETLENTCRCINVTTFQKSEQSK